MQRLAIVYAVVFALLRLSIASPEGCTPPIDATLRATATRAARWLAANQRPDGTFLYESKADGTDLGNYDDVRHAGAVLALYRAGDIAHGDRALWWAMDRVHPVAHHGAALAAGTYAALGGDALLASALVERRLRTGDHRYDDDLRALGAFLTSMQRADGGFYVGIDVDTGVVDRAGTSPYYPGEALWALARLESLFPDEPWDVPARRAARFIATKRDDLEQVAAPPLNDHWAAYGFAEMATWKVPGVDDL